VVVDNSAAFRMDPKSLCRAEINPEDIKKHKGIIAIPNCSTIQMVVALFPLHRSTRSADHRGHLSVSFGNRPGRR